MKAKSIKYSIQNPCDESWNDMTPETNGRFCGSCEKSVVDFTRMPDFSIVSYLEKHKNEKVCGRFTKPQLDRVYQLNQPASVPVFDLRAIVLGLALTTFSAVHSFAQTEPHEPVKIDTLMHQPEPMILGKIAVQHFNHEKEKMATGTVFNLQSDFKQVTVLLKTAEGKVLKTLKPDAKGKFEFDLDWKLKPAAIEVSGAGYETEYLYFSRVPTLSNLHVTLRDEIDTIRGDIQISE
ncbi:hypothetical protein D3C87_233220 [compost metagenome]